MTVLYLTIVYWHIDLRYGSSAVWYAAESLRLQHSLFLQLLRWIIKKKQYITFS